MLYAANCLSDSTTAPSFNRRGNLHLICLFIDIWRTDLFINCNSLNIHFQLPLAWSAKDLNFENSDTNSWTGQPASSSSTWTSSTSTPRTFSDQSVQARVLFGIRMHTCVYIYVFVLLGLIVQLTWKIQYHLIFNWIDVCICIKIGVRLWMGIRIGIG